MDSLTHLSQWLAVDPSHSYIGAGVVWLGHALGSHPYALCLIGVYTVLCLKSDVDWLATTPMPIKRWSELQQVCGEALQSLRRKLDAQYRQLWYFAHGSLFRIKSLLEHF